SSAGVGCLERSQACRRVVSRGLGERIRRRAWPPRVGSRRVSASTTLSRVDGEVASVRHRVGGGIFVGRERELAELKAGIGDALEGRGRLFLIAGEPGIGKSRLTDELAELARDRGRRVLWGRCWEAGGAPTYWPWVQALRAHVREQTADELREQLGASAAELAQILPEVRHSLGEVPEPSPLDPEGARFRLFDATT